MKLESFKIDNLVDLSKEESMEIDGGKSPVYWLMYGIGAGVRAIYDFYDGQPAIKPSESR